jgi:hypothetical protein
MTASAQHQRTNRSKGLVGSHHDDVVRGMGHGGAKTSAAVMSRAALHLRNTPAARSTSPSPCATTIRCGSRRPDLRQAGRSQSVNRVIGRNPMATKPGREWSLV